MKDKLLARFKQLPLVRKLITFGCLTIIFLCSCITISAMIDSSLRSAGFLPTWTPTSTPLPTDTPTITPTPTITHTPTNTPIPTNTPFPTWTPEPPTPRPTATPSPPPTDVPPPAPAVPPALPPPAEGCVDLNHAGREDLMRIVHIDAERVEDLIRWRPYTSVDQLVRISGIGSQRLQEIKDEGLACVGGS